MKIRLHNIENNIYYSFWLLLVVLLINPSLKIFHISKSTYVAYVMYIYIYIYIYT
jgi:hypothetical protein